MFNSGDMFNVGIMGVQLLGIGAAFLWAFPVSLGVFWTVRKLVGLRVENPMQVLGLDRHEHDNSAYPEFMATDVMLEAEV